MSHSTAIRIERLTDDELGDSLTTSPQSVAWKDVIVSDPKTVSGRPRVKGTRLTVEFILNLFAAGWTEAQVLENYPVLSNEKLRAVFAYAASRIGSSTAQRPADHA